MILFEYFFGYGIKCCDVYYLFRFDVYYLFRYYLFRFISVHIFFFFIPNASFVIVKINYLKKTRKCIYEYTWTTENSLINLLWAFLPNMKFNLGR